MKVVLGMMENFVRKGENAGHQHFLLFPQCCQKASGFKVIKSLDCVKDLTIMRTKIMGEDAEGIQKLQEHLHKQEQLVQV